jgi:hypothetical protein
MPTARDNIGSMREDRWLDVEDVLNQSIIQDIVRRLISCDNIDKDGPGRGREGNGNYARTHLLPMSTLWEPRLVPLKTVRVTNGPTSLMHTSTGNLYYIEMAPMLHS